MFILFKDFYEDIESEHTMAGQLEKAADTIVDLYNEACELPSGEPDVAYPEMIVSDWNTGTGDDSSWEMKDYWEVHDDPSLHLYGIEESDGCKFWQC